MQAKKNRPACWQAGFTFIELILVISIMLLIGTFSSIFFSNFLNQNAASNARDSLMGELKKAQLYSMLGKQNTGWGVTFASHSIILFAGNTYATRNTAFDEITTLNQNIAISGFSEIDFAKTTGLPNTTAAITISDNNVSKSLSINSQGVVSRQ